HHVVRTALEHTRHAAARLVAVLGGRHLIARQLAVGDDAGGAGYAHVVRAFALLDADHSRVRLDLRVEISEKRVGVHAPLLAWPESPRTGATRVPPSVARVVAIVLTVLAALVQPAVATH